ncbi:MAG: methylated-DNA--[protein]-cysteine S-methyltransferase [Oscillospiraceae bacterium]|nr:methylated-DNA--[protein]-cysteine S-methyltransferase [Oscillospiraceae bacterium]
MFEHVIQSPIGPLTLTGTEEALTRLSFGGGQAWAGSPSPALELAARELAEYFAGARREFTVPLAPEGTAFQLAVWSALREIPYGATASYRDIAVRLGKPGGAVAVGQANSRNPIPIIIPCHRIIGAGGQLVGYTGGLEIKRFLLRLEERLPG